MQDIDTLIAKFLADSCSEQESQDLQTWLDASPENTSHFQRAQALWKASATSSNHFNPDVERAWERVNHITNEGKAIRVNGYLRGWWRMAAAILLIVTIGWGAYKVVLAPQPIELDQIVTTQDSRSTEISLPDGSKVWMSAFSKLIYPAQFSHQSREVSLEGQAYFEVLSDSLRPFKIMANGTITQVLGTSFNVRAFEDEGQVQVTVASGTVKLIEEINRANEVVLTAGYKGVFNRTDQAINKEANDDANYLAWQTGVLKFSDTPLPQVLSVINEHFQSQVVIRGEGLNNCTLTSSFQQKSLEEVLDVMSVIFNLKIERSSDQIELSGVGCI